MLVIGCATVVVGAAMGFSPSTYAQAPAKATAGETDELLYVGLISGDEVYIRSGAAESYYPFYKVRRGDLVKVTGEKFGWTRVAIAGPAFAEAFGYVKHTKGDNSRFRISADGKTGTTLGRVDILAPNLDAGNQPKDSWKTLIRLEADQTVRVMETRDLGQEVVHKVSLPTTATGWISSQFVPRASAEDTELFKQMLAGKAPEAANPESSGPTNTPLPKNVQASGAGTSTTDTSGGAQPVAPGTGNGDGSATVDAGSQQPTGESSVLAGGAPTDGSMPTIAATPPTTPPVATTQPTKPAGPTFDDLEKRFEQLRREPIETAEVLPLRDLYLALAATKPNDARLNRRCSTRAKQLELWAEMQTRKQEVAAAADSMKNSAAETEAARVALERSAEYTAVGRIASSTIYDGSSLPKLFRLQDPSTGRTIAYLKPDTEYIVANRVDMIVGIVGDKVYDESLRLNIITPRRIESLSPEKTAGAPTGHAQPTEDK